MNWYKIKFYENDFEENFALIQQVFLTLFENSNFDSDSLKDIGIFKSYDKDTKETTLYFTPKCIDYVPSLSSVFELESSDVPSTKSVELALGAEASKLLLQ